MGPVLCESRAENDDTPYQHEDGQRAADVDTLHDPVGGLDQRSTRGIEGEWHAHTNSQHRYEMYWEAE